MQSLRQLEGGQQATENSFEVHLRDIINRLYANTKYMYLFSTIGKEILNTLL